MRLDLSMTQDAATSLLLSDAPCPGGPWLRRPLSHTEVDPSLPSGSIQHSLPTADPTASADRMDQGSSTDRRRVIAVILHHRGQAMLETCLLTLLASEEVELEVLLVLNHCLEELPRTALEDPRVHRLPTPRNLGFGEANNFGVQWARQHLPACDYWYFVNNDTESQPGTLAALIACQHAHPRAAIVGPQTLIAGARGHLNSLGLNVTEDAWGWDEGIGIALADYGPLPAARPVTAVTGSALLIDAEVFAAVGGWTELYDYYFEDIDLGLKVWKSGREVWLAPDAVLYHRVSATMTVGAERKFFFFWRNRLLLAGVHWPFGKLLRVLHRAIVEEVLKKKRQDSGLQRRALAGALRKLPGIVKYRWRFAGSDDWWRFLKKAGSVPPISLPAQEPEPDPNATTMPPVLEESSEPTASEGQATSRPRRGSAIPAAWLDQLALVAPPAASPQQGRRFLVFGWGPLPFENALFNAAPGARSWHFARTLADAGHAVVLVLARIPGAYVEKEPGRFAAEVVDGVSCAWLDREDFERVGTLESVVEAFAPQALVGAAPIPSLRACAVAGDLPVWVDLFGDPIAEGQAREAVFPEIETYPAYARMITPLLMRGDVISAVSERQRLAVIGQLGLAGRLRGDNVDYDFVRVVPCAAEVSGSFAPKRLGSDEPMTLLWSGGFNTWCDVPTLIAGLELAMDVDPTLHFVATGAGVAGHDDRSATEMAQRVASSRHRSRIELRGQVGRAEADTLLADADVTLVTERSIYERELGSSGRITQWLAAGKIIICTDHSEIGARLKQQGLVFSYRAGDARDLADRLLEVSRRRHALAELGLAARRYSQHELGFGKAAAELLAWAENPTRAQGDLRPAEIVLRRDADATLAAAQLRIRELEDALTAAQEERRQQQAAFEDQLAHHGKSYHELRGELGRIHQSRMWRWWMAGTHFLRWLRHPRR